MSLRNFRYSIRILKSSFVQRGSWSTLKYIWGKLAQGGLVKVFATDPDYEKEYQLWRKLKEHQYENCPELRDNEKTLVDRPLISVIMPVYNTPEPYLEQAIKSVLDQVYQEWELCIADDKSDNPEVGQILTRYASSDSRIKVTTRDRNGHISAASNSAIQTASGEYIAFLDHDDLLTPDALYQIAVFINQHPDADLIYSDEDKLDVLGTPITPYFKPDWSPDNLLSRMYTGHLSVYRRKIVDKIGGLRTGFEGSQDHDLALRFTEQTSAIYHLPKVLYHWRMHSESAALNMEVKDYASEAGRKAISEAIHRRGEPGDVEIIANARGRYRVRYRLQKDALVTIIIPTRDLADTLQICLKSIFSKTSYTNFEVIQIDNGSKEQETKDLFQSWLTLEPDRYRVIECDIPFNYSKLNNIAVTHARGEYLLFLNNDIEVISDDWLEGLLEHAQRESIGAVGAKLLYSDDTIQHAGVLLGVGELQTAGHVFNGYSANEDGYFGSLDMVTNYSAVTAACLMCKKDTFLKVGGFDEDLSVAYNDVDLCIKFRERGLNNIFVPHVRLYHYESKSRGYEDTEEHRNRLRSEAHILQKKWGDTLKIDPFYNCNLNKKLGNFQISQE